jgi:hypothetical protein
MSDETVLSDEERFESLLAAEEQPEAEVPVDAGETVEEETEEIEGEELEASEDQLDDEDATEEEPETEEPVDDGVIEFALQNGEVIRTTKDDLAGSYLRQSDYTRKTQELASERRDFEAQKVEVENYLREQINQVTQLQQAEPDENYWAALYEEDPIGAPKIERDYRVQKEQRDRLINEQNQRQQQMFQQKVQSEAQQLPNLIPAWSDTDVRARETGELSRFLVGQGFAPQDVNMVSDAKLVHMLYKGMRMIQLETNAPKVVNKKVVGKPKVIKPNAASPKRRPVSEIAKASESARSTQTNEAWADVFEKIL